MLIAVAWSDGPVHDPLGKALGGRATRAITGLSSFVIQYLSSTSPKKVGCLAMSSAATFPRTMAIINAAGTTAIGTAGEQCDTDPHSIRTARRVFGGCLVSAAMTVTMIARVTAKAEVAGAAAEEARAPVAWLAMFAGRTPSCFLMLPDPSHTHARSHCAVSLLAIYPPPEALAQPLPHSEAAVLSTGFHRRPHSAETT